ncbi:MAG TPA: tetratricopeptide repeat protein [Gemmatimonadales bacterium]|nr:tetratricopeptide repeat protein [Gemmatimonadales bacterium]
MFRFTDSLLLAGAALLLSAPGAAQGPEDQACNGGDGQACFQIGMRHLGTMDNAPGVQRSIPYFTKACDARVAKGCYALGGIYQSPDAMGLGVGQDLEKAKGFFQRACSNGFDAGCARARELNDPAHTATARRPTPAEEAGCQRGNADNCWTVALYIMGDGSDATKIGQAATPLETACNGNLGSACVMLGIGYQNGSGVTQDLGRAEALFAKACDTGVSLGCQQREQLTGVGGGAAAVSTVSARSVAVGTPTAGAAASQDAPSFEGVRLGMSPDAVRRALGDPLARGNSSDGGETWAYRNRTLGVSFNSKQVVSAVLAMSGDAGRFEGIRVGDKVSKLRDLSSKRGWKAEDMGSMLFVTGTGWSLLVNTQEDKISMLTWTVDQ